MELNWQIFMEEGFWVSIGLVILIASIITNFYLYLEVSVLKDKLTDKIKIIFNLENKLVRRPNK